jgi:hypothetical protein
MTFGGVAGGVVVVGVEAVVGGRPGTAGDVDGGPPAYDAVGALKIVAADEVGTDLAEGGTAATEAV